MKFLQYFYWSSSDTQVSVILLKYRISVLLPHLVLYESCTVQNRIIVISRDQTRFLTKWFPIIYLPKQFTRHKPAAEEKHVSVEVKLVTSKAKPQSFIFFCKNKFSIKLCLIVLPFHLTSPPMLEETSVCHMYHVQHEDQSRLKFDTSVLFEGEPALPPELQPTHSTSK